MALDLLIGRIQKIDAAALARSVIREQQESFGALCLMMVELGKEHQQPIELRLSALKAIWSLSSALSWLVKPRVYKAVAG